jgi:O-antigen/teichoic acid export membrane protein
MASLVMSIPLIIFGVFDARSGAASVKYLSEYHARGDFSCALAVCKLGFAIDLVIAIVTFVVLLFTARWAAQNIVHNPSAADLVLLYGAALIPRSLAGTSNAVLATLQRFPLIAFIEILNNSVRLALVLVFLFYGWQVAGVVVANALVSVASGFLYGACAWLFAGRAWGGQIIHAPISTLAANRQQIFTFLGYNELNALIGVVPRQLDAVLLGYFRTPTEVGYYKLAKSLASIVGYVTQPLRAVTYAELARLWGAGRRRGVSEEIRKLAMSIGVPTGLVVSIGVFFMPFAVTLLAGELYNPAVATAQLLFIASIVSLVFFWIRPVYFARGYIKQWVTISSAATIAFALIYPLIVSEWGYVGAGAWSLGLNLATTGSAAIWLWLQPQA